jgi:putative glycosyltransferase (TIGR04372 family)
MQFQTILKILTSQTFRMRFLSALTVRKLTDSLPKPLYSILSSLLLLFLSLPTKVLLQYLPKPLLIISSNLLYLTGRQSKALALFRRAQTYPESQRLATHWELEHHWRFSKPEFHRSVERYFSRSGIETGQLFDLRGWAEINLNLEGFVHVLQSSKKTLELFDENKPEYSHRFLPEFTTNMGHLGLLFPYIRYYEHNDPNRVLHLWPDKVPNRFFLEKVLQETKLSCILETGTSPRYFDDNFHYDNFIMSRESDGIWRFEPMAVTGTGAAFVGYPTESESLKLSDEEIERGWAIAKQMGLNGGLWFVALHIRENPRIDLEQTRDSSLEMCRLACEFIQAIGGQVVRMGSTHFPPIPEGFPAIDYAYSQHRSEFMDVWLWSQCRFWMGNSSGASTPPIAFGKRRICLDQWPWIIQGPSRDIVLPKKVRTFEGSHLGIPETIQHDLGRTQSPGLLQKSGLQIESNSKELVRQSVIMMLNHLDAKQVKSSHPMVDELRRNLVVPDLEETMQIPDSWFSSYE